MKETKAKKSIIIVIAFVTKGTEMRKLLWVEVANRFVLEKKTRRGIWAWAGLFMHRNQWWMVWRGEGIERKRGRVGRKKIKRSLSARDHSNNGFVYCRIVSYT